MIYIFKNRPSSDNYETMNKFKKNLFIKSITLSATIFVVAGCTSYSGFDEVKNSFLTYQSNNPYPVSEKVSDEIKLYSQRMKKLEPERLNNGYITEGLSALAKKNYTKANENFQSALKFDPQNSTLHSLNALTHQLRGEAGDQEQFKLAEVGYNLASRMDPGDSKIPYFKGILFYKQQQYRSAQRSFSKAVALDPKNENYLIGLAASSYYLGELDRAYMSIERALSFKPLNKAALKSSGVIYAALGNFEKAEESSKKLGKLNETSKKYVDKRISEWRDYYSNQTIGSDPIIKAQLTQTLDSFGIPSQAELEGTSTVNEDLSSSDGDASAIVPNTSSDVGSNEDSGAENRSPSTPKIDVPNMALIDVAIIRTEEIFKTNKGVNLLNGLNIFFTGDQLFQAATPFGIGAVRTPLTANDTLTLKLGTNGAGLTYSMNIFNDNFDRNEVIARPTILVEDQKKSSFFSGGTMHIVLEGGSAGSGYMEPIDTGVKLEVTPQFLDSNTLDLNVYVERTFLESELSQVSDILTGTSFAKTSKTTISANLALRYGETMVLSGLSDQEKETLDDKTPGLGELPIIQYFFRNQTKTSSKKTVLVLLTPRRASLNHENGVPIENNREVDDEKSLNVKPLMDWMRPNPNLSAFVKHLGKYEFFNHYRNGDMQLESWTGDETVNNFILQAIEYLYIRHDVDQMEHSEL